jgi:hypothetical protein
MFISINCRSPEIEKFNSGPSIPGINGKSESSWFYKKGATEINPIAP